MYVCMHLCMCDCVRYEWSSTALANLLYTLRGTGKVNRVDTVSVRSISESSGWITSHRLFPSLLSNLTKSFLGGFEKNREL